MEIKQNDIKSEANDSDNENKHEVPYTKKSIPLSPTTQLPRDLEARLKCFASTDDTIAPNDILIEYKLPCQPGVDETCASTISVKFSCSAADSLSECDDNKSILSFMTMPESECDTQEPLPENYLPEFPCLDDTIPWSSLYVSSSDSSPDSSPTGRTFPGIQKTLASEKLGTESPTEGCDIISDDESFDSGKIIATSDESDDSSFIKSPTKSAKKQLPCENEKNSSGVDANKSLEFDKDIQSSSNTKIKEGSRLPDILEIDISKDNVNDCIDENKSGRSFKNAEECHCEPASEEINQNVDHEKVQEPIENIDLRTKLQDLNETTKNEPKIKTQIENDKTGELTRDNKVIKNVMINEKVNISIEIDKSDIYDGALDSENGSSESAYSFENKESKIPFAALNETPRNDNLCISLTHDETSESIEKDDLDANNINKETRTDNYETVTPDSYNMEPHEKSHFLTKKMQEELREEIEISIQRLDDLNRLNQQSSEAYRKEFLDSSFITKSLTNLHQYWNDDTCSNTSDNETDSIKNINDFSCNYNDKFLRVTSSFQENVGSTNLSKSLTNLTDENDRNTILAKKIEAIIGVKSVINKSSSDEKIKESLREDYLNEKIVDSNTQNEIIVTVNITDAKADIINDKPENSLISENNDQDEVIELNTNTIPITESIKVVSMPNLSNEVKITEEKEVDSEKNAKIHVT